MVTVNLLLGKRALTIFGKGSTTLQRKDKILVKIIIISILNLYREININGLKKEGNFECLIYLTENIIQKNKRFFYSWIFIFEIE